MNTQLFSIGHSNHLLETLVALLQAHTINTLIDIRAQPYSQRNPQFVMEVLRNELELVDITYHWAGRHLGGMRRSSGDSPHRALQNEGLRAYADHMATDEFQRAVNQLIHLAGLSNTAVMCAEKLPEHCHRSILSDYLILQGVEVQHIIDEGKPQAHHLSPYARRESAALIYDRNSTSSLF